MTDIENAIAELRQGLSGTVILPADASYDAARTVVYGGIDRHPAAIARVKSAADVQRVVNVARKHSLELAVRSGGHSNAGHSTTEGGLVLDLRDMNAIEIDAAGKTAWAETGATAIEVTK